MFTNKYTLRFVTKLRVLYLRKLPLVSTDVQNEKESSAALRVHLRKHVFFPMPDFGFLHVLLILMRSLLFLCAGT